MDIIKWRSSYETGVASMDDQHRNLINLINTMYRVVRNTEEPAAIQKVLEEMDSYAENHLHEEENLLEQHGFPDLDQHASLHDDYRNKMTKLRAALDKDPASGTKEIYTFLRRWWMGHIVEEDRKYGQFLAEKGVE